MRRSCVVVMAIILVFAFYGLPLAHANVSSTRVIDVQYPAIVQTGGLFTVRIRVAFSARFGMMDVGIWDLGTGTVIQSLVTNATLSGPGQGEYNFSLEAPHYPSQWRLAAITRAWVQDAWLNDEAGEFDFCVRVAENGFLALDMLQPNLTISLDGRSIVANSSTVVIELKLGTIHSLGVSQELPSGVGRRLIFAEWSDGLGSNPRSILVTGNMSLRPIYETQYLLTVDSEIGIVAGEGWYQQGQVAQFGVPTTAQDSPIFFSLLTDSSQFINWSGDSTSTEPVTTLVMDGPKTVVAQWKQSIFPGLNGLGGIFTVGSLALLLRAWRRTRGESIKQHERSKITRLLIILLMSITIVTLPMVPALAQLPIPINASVVQIGDASWYYWKQPASDTCVLWLGGGVEYSQGGYLLNPLEYESFGTIRFLQDLTRYYCLLTLEKGSTPSPNVSNRTIYQELIQGQFSVGRQLHQWVKAQGYRHIFLVGYSVGTEAAASIVTSDPQTWTSSDGLILITAWLPPAIINSASDLNSNLMLLYGHAPTFEPTGFRFYENAPIEGWHDAGYLHKEFHVLDQMGHEVWSPISDNSYSLMAVSVIVSFIETSKSLQFSLMSFKSDMTGLPNEVYGISQIDVPRTVLWGDPFFTSAIVNSSNRSGSDLALAAFDIGTNHLLSVNQFNGTVLPSSIRLNMPPVANSSRLSFSLFVLERGGGGWKIASNAYPQVLSATDHVFFRISGLVPNSDLTVDSNEYAVSPTGQVQLETYRGVHSYMVQGTVDQNGTRYFFVQWENSDMSPARSITLTGNATVTAIYRVQYLATVTSPIGATDGTGWYDANSSSQPSLRPIVSNQVGIAFNSWTNGSESFQIGDPIQVKSPMVIKAEWNQIEPSAQFNRLTVTWVVASGILFCLLLVVNVKVSRTKPVE